MSDGHYLNTLFNMDGKTGIVTGGSSGLGLAMANMLAHAGATVHAFSRTGRVKPGEPMSPSGVQHHALDVTNRNDLTDAIQSIGEDSGLDFLVNNAGISSRALFAEMDLDTWTRIHAVNFEAVAAACKVAYPYLKRSSHPGRVVFIASMAAHLGFVEVMPYITSKTALMGLARGLAVEWAPDNILVNTVSPGWFVTPLTETLMDEERRKKSLNRIPMGRYGDLDEVAAMVLFLVSPAATYITGQDFAVDGGALAFGY